MEVLVNFRGTKKALLFALLIAAAWKFSALAQNAPITLQWQTANLTEEQFEPVWRQIIAEFQAEHPHITIEPILVARANHWTRFVTAAQARQAPCVVSVDVTTAAYNGYLRPIDDLLAAEPPEFRAAWSPDVLQAATWDGQLYGLPSWGGIYGEVYNRRLVEAAGLDPENPPLTWDDYLTWMEAMTGDNQWGLAVLGGPTDTTTRVLLTWIWSNGGEAFNADMTEATFASDPRSLEAIEFYLNLALERGVAAPGPVTTNYLEQTNLFAQEQIGSMRNAYWGFAKVLGDNPDLAGSLFAAPNPTTTGLPVTLATMTADSISSNCEHPEAAWEFIKFNNQPKWAVQRALVSNWMPLRSDLLDNAEVLADPVLAKFLEFGQTARTYPLPHPAWAEISTTDIVNAVQRALLGQGTIAEVFAQLDRDLNAKLNDY
jgi:ABC-type glycerol-3-phosphate transport system substrate-binding protein